MTSCRLVNGRILDDGVVRRGELAFMDGRVVNSVPENATVIDVDGAYILPGMIDLHVHVADRIGNYELADDYHTASAIALMNGITTLWSFITQSRDETLDAAIDRAIAKATGAGCRIGWHLTPTKWDNDTWQALERRVLEGFTTVKLYTTYRDAGLYVDTEMMESILVRLKRIGIKRVLVHCEDDSIIEKTKPRVANPELASSHPLLRPVDAELSAVKQLVTIAKRTDCPVHVVHVSTPDALGVILNAKADGVDITCETGMQYLWLNDSYLAGEEGHQWLCSPPLRTDGSALALQDAARGGAFDCFASDHCAFRKCDKDEQRSDATKVPNGIAGLGATPSLVSNLSKITDEQAMLLQRQLSEGTARVLGRTGELGSLKAGVTADIAVVRFEGDPHPVNSSLSDTYEPYFGFTSSYQVDFVFRQGEMVVRDGKLLHTAVGGE